MHACDEDLDSGECIIVFILLIFTAPKWFRKLSQVHTLTMHTAFERKDNESPAGVTALCIAR